MQVRDLTVPDMGADIGEISGQPTLDLVDSILGEHKVMAVQGGKCLLILALGTGFYRRG